MVNYAHNWTNGDNSEYGSDQQSIEMMLRNAAQRVLDLGADLTRNFQDIVHFADDISRDHNITVLKGLHQAEFYRNNWYIHFTARDSQKAFHLFVRTDPNDYENYEEGVVIISERDRLNPGDGLLFLNIE